MAKHGEIDLIALPTTIIHGQKAVTTAGTAVQLCTTERILCMLTVKALKDNTGYVYIGDSDVSASNGIELDAGDSVTIVVQNPSLLYVDSATNGDGVSYIGS